MVDDLFHQGVDEIRIDRYVYFDLPSRYDFKLVDVFYDSNHTALCLNKGYRYRNITLMLQCFSGYAKTQFLSKSISLKQPGRFICPFHWNHWRCTLYNYSGSPLEKDNVKCFCDTRYMTTTDLSNPEKEINK